MNKRYTKELLENVIKNSVSWADVCRKLDVVPFTGAQTHIKKRAVGFNIDFSHFSGKSWNKGKTFGHKRSTESFLLVNGPYINSSLLLKRLISDCLMLRRCSMCKLENWLGYDIPLELDHINGNHYDNRLENLQILCPTCHSLKHKLS